VVVFHQRFSTNTLPQWRLAHPFRYLAHNGEINTVQGNRSWAVARGPLFRSPLLPELGDILPVVSLTGSDSQSLDNMLELLLVGGLDPMHAMRMLIPPAWQSVDMIDPDLKAFYEYYATHMEPWDGPAGIVLTDGRYACCTLDRNGLRPARWVITKDRHITIASEAGVWDYLPEDVVKKGKLGPGEILALDLQTAELMDTRRVDDLLKSRHPYKAWLKKGVRYLQTDLIDPRLAAEPFDRDTLAMFQKLFNVSAEERDEIIRVLAEDESEAVGSMGDDTPMPVLSRKVRSLYDYFRQQFAQVTNPPIDSLRESIVMSLQTQIGPECNIFVPAQQHAEQIVLSSPILSQRKLRQIVALADSGVPHEFIDLQYDCKLDLKDAILAVCDQAEAAVRNGKLVLLLSDRYPVKDKLPIHALLATGAVHHRLVATGLRCKCNILVETGTARDAHHFACLIGYGATAIYPYLAYQTLFDLMRKGALNMEADTRRELGRSYRRGLQDGHIDDCELPQRPIVRDRRPLRRGGLAVLRGLRQPHPGGGLRRPEARFAVPRSARLERQRKRRTGRAAQVRAQRRVPHVQPGRDRHAAGRGHDGRLRPLQAICRARQSTAGLVPAGSSETEAGRSRHRTRGGRTGQRYPRALRQRRHVPGRTVAGGARGAGRRHEPPGCAFEFRRGRGGSDALQDREELENQAGRLRPFRRDA
jgi:glutamate synthase (NADPH/NADH) large chain